jgi:hypothetical protein
MPDHDLCLVHASIRIRAIDSFGEASSTRRVTEVASAFTLDAGMAGLLPGGRYVTQHVWRLDLEAVTTAGQVSELRLPTCLKKS